MPTRTALPSLSEDTIGTLRELKTADKENFYAYVVSLRKEGWPLRAIAEPFGVSRTAVSGWEHRYGIDRPLPPVEAFPVAPPKDRKNGMKKFHLTDAESAELARLTKDASTVRRFTDANSTSRESARILESMLYTYTQKGATRMQLAKACGVSRSAVAQRLKKAE